MILYADSGSTKTDWCLKTKEGKVLNWKSGGWNPYFLTSEQMIKEGKEFINKSYLENQEKSTDYLEDYFYKIDEIQFYGAGCSTEENRKIVYSALKTLFPQVKKIEVAHDLLGAARSVYDNTKDEMGIILILGTGSNACLYDGNDILQELTNLGFWLGDEGSGGFLGKKLVTDFLYNRLSDEIHNLFYQNYKLDREIVLKKAYQETKPNEFFASFVPFLHKYKDEKSIRKLIETTFDGFLDRIEEEFENLNINFYAVGSVAYFFEDILKERINKRKGNLVRIVKSPIEGLVGS
ncbi:putative N-acetylglucosamine kinase [Bernardetia litoralis DSM 6794]|uniref:Putative N-acetylglucosamine kinase n=1 Tax=Bernardetia litoralis (strain ATCC 23117 / DSM 6794 / NBRC 15988 / NCIMB 1366 / Fx l1 / Sio-4) TaxID=880071 RepID=I4AH21_BERLS|nr:N-acetylglucosamine kinase [Bernardetia litoralis]AFM03256.1 putative N-acetylglucosamine kinase [Bernardetia litoralis DSM 6794]